MREPGVVSLILLVLLLSPGVRTSPRVAEAAAEQRKGGNPIPMTEESIKAGSVVYAKWCRSCHGLRARGDGIAAPPGTKPANLVDAEWKHGSTDAEIFKNIKEGIAPYDAMKPQAAALSDTDIWNVINHLRSLAKKAADK
jgi:mono/diheme cytochrome c family protein